MQPSHYDLLGQVQDDPRSVGRMTQDAHQPPREPLSLQHLRSPAAGAPTRSEDSWIEVSSQPSSSSLSSAGTSDDIITTGLRVEQNTASPYHRRRRRLQHLAAVTTAEVDYSQQSSSQDEYEESESESDRVLSSSNEDIVRPPLGNPLLPQPIPASSPLDEASSDDDDDDDNSTALGMRMGSSPFVPQPNVFSHPPASQNPSWTRPTERPRPQPSEVSNSSRRTAIRRNSQASIRSTRRPSQQHSPFNMISPSHHADHDAALRASLSTLLSCAAAARGLPKSDTQPQQQQQQQQQPGPSRGGQPSTFRLVSESVAMGEEDEEVCSDEEEETTVPRTGETNAPTRTRRQRPTAPPMRMAAYSPRPATPAPREPKRRSSPSKDRNHSSAKKSRRASLQDAAGAAATASPTIMTWVISAGVVVLFSAISFSAGYVLGREVGKLEANSTALGSVTGGSPETNIPTRACGQEAVRGSLKRLRWGSGTSASGIIA
ncbi:hypothetical protein BO71DRAFT_337994 [Aspergillus ellipticus CBS 707.79]|uniref:Uncharacterized protein n=1 Tax=Aspergillus ellipticus CBS 707.79 TaxID=1448320 RepID=A0A319DCW6_9EURO|nr:hypothetical protein BO71DRAFT_337994 [Aspergillus ellipticus CBS 707.79]